MQSTQRFVGHAHWVRACSGSVTRQLRWDLQFLRYLVTRQHSGAVLAAADCVYAQRDSLLECPESAYQWIRLDRSRRIQDFLWHGADTAYEHDRAHKSRSTGLRCDRAADRNEVLFRRHCCHDCRSGERPVADCLHYDRVTPGGDSVHNSWCAPSTNCKVAGYTLDSLRVVLATSKGI
jgi:hypothetical protein